MEALCGGEVYIHHIRVFRNDIRPFVVKVSISTELDKLEETREFIRKWYDAERILLSYDYADDGR